MARALICPAPDQLEWRDVPDRVPGPGEVRIEAHHGAAKHGTEMTYFHGKGERNGGFDGTLRMFRGDLPTGTYPFPVGNMTVGIVTDAAPDAIGVTAGDRVLCHSGFQDVVTTKAAGCWKLPASLAWQSAVCVDPADFAMGAIRDGHVRLGDDVAVFGLGAIGLMTVQLLKAAGAARIIALDPLPARRALAATFGASVTIDPADGDPGAAIRNATSGRGVDVVIEFSGSRQALQASLRGCGYCGTVVLGAFAHPYDAGLDFGTEGHMNNVTLVFTRACSEPSRDFPRWDEKRIMGTCLRMFIDGSLRGDEIVTPVVPARDLREEYLKLAGGKSRAIKLGVQY
jgi:threonine dehydrogenase-like Zn-dependent dehydrogenase